jgi:hypothetical protein
MTVGAHMKLCEVSSVPSETLPKRRTDPAWQQYGLGGLALMHSHHSLGEVPGFAPMTRLKR